MNQFNKHSTKSIREYKVKFRKEFVIAARFSYEKTHKSIKKSKVNSLLLPTKYFRTHENEISVLYENTSIKSSIV